MAKTYRLNVGARLINFMFRARSLGRPLAGCRIRTGRMGANARAAGEVMLSRGGRSEKFRVDEAATETAIPVLRAYIDEIKVTRPDSDANPGSPDDAIAAELKRHAVPIREPAYWPRERTSWSGGTT